MKKVQILLALVILPALCFSQEMKTEDIYALLFSACAAEQEESFAAEVKKAGKGIEPELIKIVTEGPSKEQLATVQKEAARKFSERQEHRARGGTLPLSKEILDKVEVESRQDYIKRNVESYREGMIKQAMSALGVLGSDLAIQRLKQVSRSQNSPYRDHATFVLKHFVQ